MKTVSMTVRDRINLAVDRAYDDFPEIVGGLELERINESTLGFFPEVVSDSRLDSLIYETQGYFGNYFFTEELGKIQFHFIFD